jgi:hypothetical protein
MAVHPANYVFSMRSWTGRQEDRVHWQSRASSRTSSPNREIGAMPQFCNHHGLLACVDKTLAEDFEI